MERQFIALPLSLADRIGAQILRELKVGRMRVLATPRKMPSMAGWQLEITGYESPARSGAT